MSLAQTLRRLIIRDKLPRGETPAATLARGVIDQNDNLTPVAYGLFAAIAAATVGNTGTETTLIGTGKGSLTLPGGFWRQGKSVFIRMSGVISTKASTVGNLTIKVKAGTTVLGTATIAALASSMSGLRWTLECELVCRTAGAAGTLECVGDVSYGVTASAVQSEVIADNLTSSFNTNGGMTLNVTATWATSDAGNTLTANVARAIVIPAD